ncbi:MAG: hypothetical protein P8169_05010 [Chloroflexota bacterium]
MDSGKWWVSLVEGIVAILLGLYLLFGGDSAAGAFALVAGIYVLVVGILELWRGRGTVSRYRGLIGVIVGALILVLYFVDIFNTPLDFTLFAIGTIIVGAIGLYASFLFWRCHHFRFTIIAGKIAPEQPTLEDIVDAANDDASDKMS